MPAAEAAAVMAAAAIEAAAVVRGPGMAVVGRTMMGGIRAAGAAGIAVEPGPEAGVTFVCPGPTRVAAVFQTDEQRDDCDHETNGDCEAEEDEWSHKPLLFMIYDSRFTRCDEN
jgi:hypothetical protein